MKLFSEFPEITREQWENAILQDLKGQDYNKKLIWNTEDGLRILPYYREEDLPAPFPSPPGMPFDWNCVEEILSTTPSDAMGEIRNAIQSDANALKIVSIWNRSEIYGVELSSVQEIAKWIDTLFEFVGNRETILHIYWDTSSSSPAFMQAWKESVRKPVPIVSHFLMDPLTTLTLCGEFPNTTENVWKQVCSSIRFSNDIDSIVSVLSASAIPVAHSGGSLIQELACALAMGTEYLNRITEYGYSAEEIVSKIVFRFAVGSNYFHEIAKFRAFRFLWNRILEAYEVPESLRSCHILAETTEWNLTIYDPYVNMLRVTTEAMSAILGGVNALLVHPFNRVYSAGDPFSRRIARNVHHLLRYEAYINKVIDPGNGSYYLETITKEICEKSWNLFQEIEKRGGYVEALKQGCIQDWVEEMLQFRLESILNKKSPILGTSQYPNPKDETPIDARPGPQKRERSPFPEFIGEPDFRVRPLNPRRAALELETLRKNVEAKFEKAGRKPIVYLLLAGHKTMRTARADFAGNFLGVVGAEILNTGGTETPEEKIAEISQYKPDLVVYCSSDEEYPELVRTTLSKIREASPTSRILVAGNPESSQELKSMGVQGFIHLKSHLYNTLQELFL